MKKPNPGGLLDFVQKQKLGYGYGCRNCDNLIEISEKALGCVAHDKLILPDFIPYINTNTQKCKGWEKIKKREVEE